MEYKNNVFGLKGQHHKILSISKISIDSIKFQYKFQLFLVV